MNFPNNNGYDQHEYPAEFGPAGITPQNFHGNTVAPLSGDNYYYQPSSNPQTNINAQNNISHYPNGVYPGQEYQSTHGYASILPHQIYVNGHHECQQQPLYQVTQNLQNNVLLDHVPIYTGSDNVIQQNQDLQNSPMNFRVPSITSQTSNENISFGTLPPKDVSYGEYLTDEEFAELMKGGNPDDPTIEVPLYPLPLTPPFQQNMNLNDVQAASPVLLHSPTSSSSSSPTENPVGRPPIYETPEQRLAAHRESSRKSYQKRKAEKDRERKELEEIAIKKETENQNLRKVLAALQIQASNYFDKNCQSFPDELRNEVYQKIKTFK